MRNITKDKIKAIIFLIVIFLVGIFIGKSFCQCYKINKAIISEYKSRPMIIREETEEDRFWQKQWREQYSYQYDLSFEEVDECVNSWAS